MPDAVWVYSTSIMGSDFLECGTCGATVQRVKKVQHENFHKTFSYRRNEDMSTVKWCDYGDHAFKAGEQGSASFSGTEFDENGMPRQTEMDACKTHNPLNIAREASRYELTPAAYEELNKECK